MLNKYSPIKEVTKEYAEGIKQELLTEIRQRRSDRERAALNSQPKADQTQREMRANHNK